MRILRTIFLLTGAAVFMPSPPDAPQQASAAAVDSSGLLVSAAAAVSDVASFCGRQPGVCQTAGYVAGRLEAKAKYSVRLIYEWANASDDTPGSDGETLQAAADPLATGSTVQLAATPGDGQSTLRLDDLIPEWRGPVKHPKG